MTNQNNNETKQEQRKMGVGMFVLAWIALIVLLVGFFHQQLSHQFNPNQQLQSQTSSPGINEVILEPNRQHHYILNGLINGHSVVFLLDTGATDVVIPQHMAQKLQLKVGRKQYASTANGTISVYSTQLNSIDIGGIVLTNIRASINPAMKEEVILLGMSALREIEFAQRGDTLLLRQLPAL